MRKPSIGLKMQKSSYMNICKQITTKYKLLQKIRCCKKLTPLVVLTIYHVILLKTEESKKHFVSMPFSTRSPIAKVSPTNQLMYQCSPVSVISNKFFCCKMLCYKEFSLLSRLNVSLRSCARCCFNQLKNVKVKYEPTISDNQYLVRFITLNLMYFRQSLIRHK